MKKALLVIAVIAILSGCGSTKTMTCTRDNTLGDVTSKSTYKIDYKDDEIKMLTVTYEYKDNRTDGVGTGTDGTTNDDDKDNSKDNKDNSRDNKDENMTDNNMTDNNKDDNDVIDGVVGEALDDVVSGVANGVLDIAGIKTSHDTKFGTYTNTEGFTTSTDVDDDKNYKVTYTYDLSKLSDEDLQRFGIDRDLNTQKNTYTSNGSTCK